MRTVLTYGTFDLFHIGHLNLLKRLKSCGDRLIVGVSTDEFNSIKGKSTVIPYRHRAEIVSAISYVDKVIPEDNWDQKIEDIKRESVSVFAMGDDWAGRFDFLSNYCEVLYLPRTKDVSTTEIKSFLRQMEKEKVEVVGKYLKTALDILGEYNNENK